MANWSDPRTSAAAYAATGARTDAYDAGLRSYMLSVYNYMASGVLLTGIVALLMVYTGAVQSLFNPETGSPSLPGRDQVASLETMLSVVRELAGELGITVYELFGLRDADTAGGEALGAFGLVTDEYARKPSFDFYRSAVRQG